MVKARSPLFFVCILFSAWATAQPVLSKGTLPVAGTVYGYHDVPYLPPGGPGEGLRWDYTALPAGTLVPYAWATTDVAPGAGAFPQRAVVQEIPGEPASYFLSSDTALIWLGTYSDTAMLRFDPPLRSISFPCSIGRQWVDSGIVAVTGSGRIAIHHVVHTVKAEAWGSLTMPYGVVPDALRLRSELTFTHPRFPDQPIRREVRYSWYCNATPMPLLVIIERSGWYPPDKLLRWLDGSWREGEQSLFRPMRLHVFPDPCDDMATIDLPASRADRTVLQLVDGTGTPVKEWLAEFTSPETRRLVLAMGDVPSGHYTLSWVGTNGTLGSVRLTKR